jgi:pseudouridine synthase
MGILYNDSSFIIAHKPFGQIVYGDPSAQDPKERVGFKETLEKSGIGFLYPVHRIDKTTEGLVLFARKKQIALLLSQKFHRQQIQKTYQAWVQGVPEQNNFIIKTPLKKHKGEGLEAAESSVRLLKKIYWGDERLSLLEIKPKTGRYHQIRRHLSSLRLPIVGDKLYGYQMLKIPVAPGIFLLAYQLEFSHPITSRRISIKAVIPKRFLIVPQGL